MRLTPLASEIVERLVGAPDILQVRVMRRPWPGIWIDQAIVLKV